MSESQPPVPGREVPEHRPKAHRIDHTDPTSFNRFLSGIASAFISTPMTRAFITEIDDTPPPYSSSTIGQPRILQHLTPGVTSAAAENAVILESGDYSAMALWETTTFTGLPFTAQAQAQQVGPIRGGWRRQVNSLKEQHIGTIVNERGETVLKPHYHLGFLVRNPEVPYVTGAISAVVRPMLDEAAKEGVVVWLEATYEHAVQVYEHFGFRTVEVIRVGAGSRAEDGWPEEGGVGARGWAMIFDRHLHRRE